MTRDALAGGEGARRLRLPGRGVLDRLRLVEHHPPPRDVAQCLDVARGDRVGRDHEVGAGDGLLEPLAAGPVGAVVHVDGQVGSEPLRLALPVADERHRADEERGPRGDVLSVPGAGGSVEREEGEDLHGLAQAHVVGEHAAEPDPVEEGQPGQPALLVRAQRAREARRRRYPLEAFVRGGRQQVGDPALALDAEHRQPGGVLVEGGRESEHLGERQRR